MEGPVLAVKRQSAVSAGRQGRIQDTTMHGDSDTDAPSVCLAPCRGSVGSISCHTESLDRPVWGPLSLVCGVRGALAGPRAVCAEQP